MSDHYNNAWVIPTNNLKALIAVAQQVAHIHQKTVVNDIVRWINGNPWIMEDAQKLKSSVDPERLLHCMGKFRKCVYRCRNNPTIIMPRNEEELLRTEYLEILGKDIPESVFSVLKIFSSDLFEMIMQYSGSEVAFLPGTGRNTIMKVAAPTDEVIRWCNKHFDDCHYQDATDEPLASFDSEMAALLNDLKADSDCPLNAEQLGYVKQVISNHHQSKRGKLWKRAMGGRFSIREAALSYPCYRNLFDIDAVAMLVARKLLDLKL